MSAWPSSGPAILTSSVRPSGVAKVFTTSSTRPTLTTLRGARAGLGLRSRVAPHQPDRRAAPRQAQLAGDLEPVALVQRAAARCRRFQVGGERRRVARVED